ncbi:CobW family GTP-binding protein [Oceanobacter mangrovi]|uniref:CobW family GTP-binding protein n=1 Tax=Oceanobacter mangrovi TaxID=2862510 RepID=UPI001C8E7255|nr:GTP-binding protein [Oceanobacter mangrovi]
MNKPAVRIHLITGFLGTGKTTSILHLLKHKPADEKWAVLVNEFGEVGVDGAIIKSLGDGIAVREVPGGCLCCVSGLPFQIGLNSLIGREKPDVLLIEPTGLGHPRQILEILRQPAYQDVLDVGVTVTLVDPRHLGQPKYRQHSIYADQLAVADVLVANKLDLCEPADLQAWHDCLEQLRQTRPALQAVEVQQGQLDPVWLTPVPESSTQTAQPPEPLPALVDLSQPLALAAGEDFRALSNQTDGFYSLGWLINSDWRFAMGALRDWLSGLAVERAKAILATDAGVMVFNLREGALSEQYLGETDAIAYENRLELIDSQPLDCDQLQASWLACKL